jgi:hypothetical protein
MASSQPKLQLETLFTSGGENSSASEAKMEGASYDDFEASEGKVTHFDVTTEGVAHFDELDDELLEADDFFDEKLRKLSTTMHDNPIFDMKRPSIDIPFSMKRPSIDVPFSDQPTIEVPLNNRPTITETLVSSTSECPLKNLPDHGSLAEGLRNLPAFKNGCTFKEAADMETVFKKMEVMAQEDETFGEALKLIVEEAQKPKDVASEWQDIVEMVKVEGSRILESLERARWDNMMKAEVSKTLSSRDLSDALKEDTQEAHLRAERCEFMHAFIKGTVTRDLYREFLGCLYYIYEAMENEIEKNKDNNVLATIYFPVELNRLEYLEEDLQFYYGPNWRDQFQLTEGNKVMGRRLRHYVNRH